MARSCTGTPACCRLQIFVALSPPKDGDSDAELRPLEKDLRAGKEAIGMNKTRCAIYTRKSSEEGLDQDFNSLDAQHEACVAYIASQRHEGWVLVNERYDEGGISGGHLDRPALQRLMDDVEAGRVDAPTGWRMILLGAVSNVVFKCAAAGALGGWALLRRLSLYLAVAVATCVALMLLLPRA